ncbi:MAG: molybdenum cofactor biosysynthesis protein [Verrucomicrobia bacterium]|jgi:MOSC domain-containing protein YiiM|nr:molybdenum cofactor biosysynthesis protein [Verrucomicrobiota bacterium]
MDEAPPQLDCRIEHIYISKGHNYVGHHGKPPGTHQILEIDEVECVEGSGLTGDRYFDHKDNYKGQITFFEMEIYEKLCNELEEKEKLPSAFRRNILTRGIDLNKWIGRKFSLQGILFEGSEECRPCYWMDQGFAAGADAALKNHGGLRARILSTGILRVT